MLQNMNLEGLQRKLLQRTQKKRFAFFLVADILSVAAAVSLAFLLRFEGTIPTQYLGGGFQAAVALVFFATIPVFLFFRLYLFTWSYVSIGDLLLLARTLLVSALIAGTLFLVLRKEEFFIGFPRSVFLITYLLLFLFTGGLRFSKRVYLQWLVDHKGQKAKERTLIVGAGDEGEEILRSILQSQKSRYLPVGFVDAHASRVGATIHGVRVLGKVDDLEQIVREYDVETLIIALPPRNSAEIRMAIELGRKSGLQKIQIVPPLSELIGGQISIRDLREVQVEDLLGREQVALDQRAIGDFIANKRVLITGAAGSIGAELSRQIARFSPARMILVDQDETGMFWLFREWQDRFPQIPHYTVVADIRDEQKMRSILEFHRPEIIFHAAAYKHVPLMEEQADEAVKNNVFGTKIIAETAIENRVEKLVFISCLDEKTKVLTKEGLKRWDEIKSGMKTLSLNPKGEIEENEVEEVVSQKYLGPMWEIKTRSIDMLVTPNHKMIIQLPNNSAYIVEEQARETVQRSVVYIPKGKWVGIDEEWFSLPSPSEILRHPPRNCPPRVRTEDMLYLLGIFIGDGFLNSGYKRRDGRETENYGSIFLDIPENDKARKRTLAVLDEMGITYKCYKGKAGEHIYFSSRVLTQVLSTCGKGAENKIIPDWALRYSPRLLQSLLDGLIDSDGYRSGSQQKLSSVSPKLMEKCAEVAVKIGLHFTISVQKNKGAMIGNRVIAPSQAFIGIFSKTSHRAFNKEHCRQVPYEGIIWCVRVKKNHNFLAERNGKFFFTGNTDKAVNPTSIMGATKRVGEMICQMLNAKNFTPYRTEGSGAGHTKFVSVRFGNVLDSRGSVIPIFREQIKKGGPVTVTHPDMRRYFMSNPEACLLVLEAAAIGQGGEVFVLDMGSPMKIVDLAKEMIRLSGYEPDKDIPIVFTGERAGEKFFEDILTAEEGTYATKNEKIFVAKLSSVDKNTLEEGLELLRKVVPTGEREEIIRVLRSIVPNYTSSRTLDQKENGS